MPVEAQASTTRCSAGTPRTAAPLAYASPSQTPARSRPTAGSHAVGANPVSASRPLVSEATPAPALVSSPVKMVRDQPVSGEPEALDRAGHVGPIGVRLGRARSPAGPQDHGRLGADAGVDAGDVLIEPALSARPGVVGQPEEPGCLDDRAIARGEFEPLRPRERAEEVDQLVRPEKAIAEGVGHKKGRRVDVDGVDVRRGRPHAPVLGDLVEVVPPPK